MQLARKIADKSKKLLLDSGANTPIVSSLLHLDPNTTPSFHRADKPSRNVETANNYNIEIQGQGIFNGLNSMLCDSATNNLLTASQFTRKKNAVVIIFEKDEIGMEADGTDNYLINAAKILPSNKIK